MDVDRPPEYRGLAVSRCHTPFWTGYRSQMQEGGFVVAAEFDPRPGKVEHRPTPSSGRHGRVRWNADRTRPREVDDVSHQLPSILRRGSPAQTCAPTLPKGPASEPSASAGADERATTTYAAHREWQRYPSGQSGRPRQLAPSAHTQSRRSYSSRIRSLYWAL